MNLYIVRHGETLWNRERRLQGWKNSPLSENGIRVAKKLGKKLEEDGVVFDKIYSSNQTRAVETAEIIRGENKDIEIEELDGLKELGYGVWEGMNIEEIKKQYGKEFDTYLNKTHLYEPLGDGESFDEIFARVEESLKYIISSGGENILIVTHGVTLKVITGLIKNIPLEKFYTIPIHKGTALNICRVEDMENIEFICEGDMTHFGERYEKI